MLHEEKLREQELQAIDAYLGDKYCVLGPRNGESLQPIDQMGAGEDEQRQAEGGLARQAAKSSRARQLSPRFGRGLEKRPSALEEIARRPGHSQPNAPGE